MVPPDAPSDRDPGPSGQATGDDVTPNPRDPHLHAPRSTGHPIRVVTLIALCSVGGFWSCFSLPLGGDQPEVVGTPTPVPGTDHDQDGFTTPEDCRDDNPDIHPQAAERCGDGIDQNCNGSVDEQCQCTPSDLLAALEASSAHADTSPVIIECEETAGFRAGLHNPCNNTVLLASSTTCFVEVVLVRIESDDERPIVDAFPENCDAPDTRWSLGPDESLTLSWNWPQEPTRDEAGDFQFRATWANGAEATLNVSLLPCDEHRDDPPGETPDETIEPDDDTPEASVTATPDSGDDDTQHPSRTPEPLLTPTPDSGDDDTQHPSRTPEPLLTPTPDSGDDDTQHVTHTPEPGDGQHEV